MSEPLYAPQSSEKKPDSLWERAPAWRGLTVTASFFTLAAVALPLLLPRPEAPHVALQRVAQHVAVSAPAPVAIAIAQPAPPMAALVVAAGPQTTAPVHAAGAAAHAAAPPLPRAPTPAPVQTASLPPVAAPSPGAQVAPSAAPATQSNVCLMVMPTSPNAFGSGVVMSFEDHATSMARIQFTESHSGGKIDPAYVDNQRVLVRMNNGQNHVFLVPKTLQVQAGDRVVFQGSFRNINLPCNYVPNLITADTGPAPQNAASGPPVQPLAR